MKAPDCSQALLRAIDSRRPASAARPSRAPGFWGARVGRCSWNSVSAARIATTGAEAALARFPAPSSGSRRSLASAVRTKVIRNGWLFIAVGANLARS